MVMLLEEWQRKIITSDEINAMKRAAKEKLIAISDTDPILPYVLWLYSDEEARS